MKSCWLSRDDYQELLGWLSGAVDCQEPVFVMSYCLFIAVVCVSLLLVKNCFNVSLCDRKMTF